MASQTTQAVRRAGPRTDHHPNVQVSHRRTVAPLAALLAVPTAVGRLVRAGSALASGLRRFGADARAACQDRTRPPPIPQLYDYPIRRGC